MPEKQKHETPFISLNIPTHNQVEELIEVLIGIKAILGKFYREYHHEHRPFSGHITFTNVQEQGDHNAS